MENLRNYFVFISKKGGREVLPLIGADSVSFGDGLDLSSKYAYDYTHRSQGVTRRVRNTARTGTIRMAFTCSECPEGRIYDYIAQLEDSAGQNGELYWNGTMRGKFMIHTVQFSITPDSTNPIPACNVGLSITESYTPKPVVSGSVSTL